MNNLGVGRKSGFAAPALILAAVFGTAGLYSRYVAKDTVDITVKDKIVKPSQDQKDGKYLVFTDSETFENTDSILRWKFNSSDLQGSLDRGKSYRCGAVGWRIPLFSEYRNLISCKAKEGAAP